MIIKHWQGYGKVKATKEKNELGSDLHIKVKGNHEWGIVREDRYDIFNWLVKRFDKTIESYRNFTCHVEMGPDEDGEETCHYYIYKCS